MKALNELTSAGKKRKRVGRGGARGGTSGKGHKGQKARSGPSIGIAFEGGQMPLTRRLPKRGFSNARFEVVYEVLNLKALNNAFETGATVTKEALVEKGLIKNAKTLLKILGDGKLDKQLTVHADAFSKSAHAGITSAGGNVHLTKEK
jgi:large subunit ribosomal protein L15